MDKYQKKAIRYSEYGLILSTISICLLAFRIWGMNNGDKTNYLGKEIYDVPFGRRN